MVRFAVLERQLSLRSDSRFASLFILLSPTEALSFIQQHCATIDSMALRCLLRDAMVYWQVDAPEAQLLWKELLKIALQLYWQSQRYPGQAFTTMLDIPCRELPQIYRRAQLDVVLPTLWEQEVQRGKLSFDTHMYLWQLLPDMLSDLLGDAWDASHYYSSCLELVFQVGVTQTDAAMLTLTERLKASRSEYLTSGLLLMGLMCKFYFSSAVLLEMLEEAKENSRWHWRRSGGTEHIFGLSEAALWKIWLERVVPRIPDEFPCRYEENLLFCLGRFCQASGFLFLANLPTICGWFECSEARNRLWMHTLGRLQISPADAESVEQDSIVWLEFLVKDGYSRLLLGARESLNRLWHELWIRKYSKNQWDQLLRQVSGRQREKLVLAWSQWLGRGELTASRWRFWIKIWKLEGEELASGLERAMKNTHAKGIVPVSMLYEMVQGTNTSFTHRPAILDALITVWSNVSSHQEQDTSQWIALTTLLVQRGAMPLSASTTAICFQRAAETQCMPVLQALYACEPTLFTEEILSAILQASCKSGFVVGIRWLIGNWPRHPLDAPRGIPLGMACCQGHADVVEALLSAGVSPLVTPKGLISRGIHKYPEIATVFCSHGWGVELGIPTMSEDRTEQSE
jgi:hypothetical protein